MLTCVSIIGPAGGQTGTLTRAISIALEDANVRQVIYLGDDEAAHDVVGGFLNSGLSPNNFLDYALDAAIGGDAARIQALLDDEARGRRLSAVRCLPKPPVRAIELLDRWILLAVHDKAVLDEDDIANAQVILYGKSDAPTLKRFGQRYFFTPGPLNAGHVGLLSLQDDGTLVLELRDLDGRVHKSETLQSAAGKVRVTA